MKEKPVLIPELLETFDNSIILRLKENEIWIIKGKRLNVIHTPVASDVEALLEEIKRTYMIRCKK